MKFIEWYLRAFADVKTLCRIRELTKKQIARRIKATWVEAGKNFLEPILTPYIGEDVNLMMFDRLYRVINFTGLQQIIDVDYTNFSLYKPELADCDDKAAIFYANVRENYGYTAVGFCIGSVHDKHTEKLIGYHAYNICFVFEPETGYDCYLFEPQTDALDTDKDSIIGNWKYNTLLVIL